MTTDLATVDSWAPMLPAVGDLANKIAGTSFVPKALRGKPAETAACILSGREIGIGPMESLQKIHVIDGRPSLSAELMRSLVLRQGHAIEFTTITDSKVTIRGKRAGSDTWTEITWTMTDAQRIGVTGKQTWKQYPRQMLSARATSELCRLIFPDALGGISYTPEEIEDEAATTTVTVARADKPAKVQRAKVAAPEPVEPSFDEPEPVADAETGEIVDAEVVEDGPELISDAQQRKMRALLTAVGMTDRDKVLQYVRAIVGRDVDSSKGLTKTEASTVIDALTELEQMGTEVEVVDEPMFEDVPE